MTDLETDDPERREPDNRTVKPDPDTPTDVATPSCDRRAEKDKSSPTSDIAEIKEEPMDIADAVKKEVLLPGDDGRRQTLMNGVLSDSDKEGQEGIVSPSLYNT